MSDKNIENNVEKKVKDAYEYATFFTTAHQSLNKEYLNQKLLDKPSKDIHDIINRYKLMGNQAKKIYQAYDIIRSMIKQGNTISLSVASNILMSNRIYINYLIKHRLIDCVVTTCGAFEEDIMHDLYKSHFFTDEEFWQNGSITDDIKLKKMGINRSGDILIPNEYYFNLWSKIYENIKIKNMDASFSFKDFFKEILNTLELSNCSVFKNLLDNDIPFFIPAPTDGAVGDFIFFQNLYANRQYHPSLSKDYNDMANFYMDNQNNMSVILLGGGTAKHHNLLHCIYAKGANKAVYINTSSDYDNSDSGGPPSEAITWGKIKTDADFVKVTTEASTCFPLIIEAIRYEFNLI
jgi:deoxyhypusine synthase